MSDQTTRLVLNIVPGPEDDTEQLEVLTQQLREELIELDVEAVDFINVRERHPRVKSGDPFTWGMLVVTLAASGGVLTKLIDMLQSWLTRSDSRSLSLEIDGDKLEVTDISSQKQQQLIEYWLSRHSGGQADD